MGVVVVVHSKNLHLSYVGRQLHCGPKNTPLIVKPEALRAVQSDGI